MEQRSIPQAHEEFLRGALPLLQVVASIIGVAAGGSYTEPGLDEYSDLDLIVVTSDADLPTNRERRVEIAGNLGDLIACFTAEHVGEPRLLICLYGPWPLHVDIKFTTLEGFESRVEDPTILYDPSGELAQVIRDFPARYPLPDLQWAEDRIWIWIHYAATKLRRGELLTAKQTADYLLQRIIGPLLLHRAGIQPNQLRRLEQINPPELAAVQKITSASGPGAVKDALQAAAELYRVLQETMGPNVSVNSRAEAEAMRYLASS